jgi:hypothetical protein
MTAAGGGGGRLILGDRQAQEGMMLDCPTEITFSRRPSHSKVGEASFT